MFKRLMAVFISLQLIFSGPLLAQNAGKTLPDSQDVEILLDKPQKLIAGFDNTALKIIGGSGAVYAISKLLSKNAKITEKLKKLTAIFQRDEKSSKEIMLELFSARSAEFKAMGLDKKIIEFDSYSAYLKGNLLQETSKELSARGREIENLKRTIRINNSSITSLKNEKALLSKVAQENVALKEQLVNLEKYYAFLEKKSEISRLTIDAMSDVMNEVRVSATKARGMKNIIAKQSLISEHLSDLAVNLTKFSEAQMAVPTKANIEIQKQLRAAIQKTVTELEQINPGNKTLSSKVGEALRSAKGVLQRTASKSGGMVAGVLIVAGIVALSFIPEDIQAAPISNSRTEMRRMLLSAKSAGGEDFALTVLALSQANKRLVADVVAESAATSDDFYTPLKAQIEAMTSADNVSATRFVVEYAAAEQQSLSNPYLYKNNLIKSLKVGDKDSFKAPYSFGL